MKTGDVVQVIFLDHSSCIGGNVVPGSVPFEVFGRVTRVSADDFDIAYWNNVDGSIDHNTERLSIVLGAVKKIKVLLKAGK